MTEFTRGPDPAADEPVGAELRQLIMPVDEIASAVAFYENVLGLRVRFRDGARFAALAAGPVTLGLSGPEEDIAMTSAPAFKLADLDGFLDRLSASSGTVLRGPEAGPHERRAVVSDPWGNRMIVYVPSVAGPKAVII